MIEKDLAHFDINGKFRPNTDLKLVITDPHSRPISVHIYPSGMQIENPAIYEKYLNDLNNT